MLRPDQTPAEPTSLLPGPSASTAAQAQLDSTQQYQPAAFTMPAPVLTTAANTYKPASTVQPASGTEFDSPPGLPEPANVSARVAPAEAAPANTGEAALPEAAARDADMADASEAYAETEEAGSMEVSSPQSCAEEGVQSDQEASEANLSSDSSAEDSLLASAPTQEEGTPVAGEASSNEAHSMAVDPQPSHLQLDQPDLAASAGVHMQQDSTSAAEAAQSKLGAAADPVAFAVATGSAGRSDSNAAAASAPLESAEQQAASTTAASPSRQTGNVAAAMDTDRPVVKSASSAAQLDIASAVIISAGAQTIPSSDAAVKDECPFRALAASAREAEEFANRVLASPGGSAAEQQVSSVSLLKIWIRCRAVLHIVCLYSSIGICALFLMREMAMGPSNLPDPAGIIFAVATH